MEKINQITRYTTNKAGDALVTKTGRPYTSVRIKTQEHGDKLISGFGNPVNDSWKVGDKVEIIVVQKGEYLNFEMPKVAPKEFPASDTKVYNLLNLQVIPYLKQLHAMVHAIADQTGTDISDIVVSKPEYPEMTSENDAHGL